MLWCMLGNWVMGKSLMPVSRVVWEGAQDQVFDTTHSAWSAHGAACAIKHNTFDSQSMLFASAARLLLYAVLPIEFAFCEDIMCL